MKTSKKSNFRIGLAILGLCMALCMPAAQAGTITVLGSGLGIDLPLVVNGTPETGFTGQFFVSLNNQTLITYCLDLFTGIDYISYNNIIGPPSSYNNGQRAAWVLENFGGGVGTNEQAAALQLALWDIVHDGGDGLSNGSVILGGAASAALRSAAQSLILASVGQSSNNALILYNTDISTGAGVQTLITFGPGSSVPEPATYGMIGAGLLILGQLRRRRQQSRSV